MEEAYQLDDTIRADIRDIKNTGPTDRADGHVHVILRRTLPHKTAVCTGALPRTSWPKSQGRRSRFISGIPGPSFIVSNCGGRTLGGLLSGLLAFVGVMVSRILDAFKGIDTPRLRMFVPVILTGKLNRYV